MTTASATQLAITCSLPPMHQESSSSSLSPPSSSTWVTSSGRSKHSTLTTSPTTWLPWSSFWLFCNFIALHTNNPVMKTAGSVGSLITYYGETLFHVLTCVERHLAVVHQIIYLILKNARGVRIRNISIGCAWILCFGLIGIHRALTSNSNLILLFFFLSLSIILTSFCSLSVLFVLIRPGPGKTSRKRDQSDQSKRKALYTITAITCILWLWFFGLLISNALRKSIFLSSSVKCVAMTSGGWLNLPSSLVLYMLYLHRAGKLSCSCLKHH